MYKIGDKVQVFRRADGTKPRTAASVMIWGKAEIVGGPLILGLGSRFWVVKFTDGYISHDKDGNAKDKIEIFEGNLRPMAIPGGHDSAKAPAATIQVKIKPKRVIPENCPRCGDAGEWRMMALVCRHGHGVFQG